MSNLFGLKGLDFYGKSLRFCYPKIHERGREFKTPPSYPSQAPLSVVDCKACFCFVALPALFKHELQNMEAEESSAVTLQCELTKPNVPVGWKKGPTPLSPSSKYEMRQRGSIAELVIHDLQLEDSGEYTCDSGDQQTTAAVAVHGRQITATLDIRYEKKILVSPGLCVCFPDGRELQGRNGLEYAAIPLKPEQLSLEI